LDSKQVDRESRLQSASAFAYRRFRCLYSSGKSSIKVRPFGLDLKPTATQNPQLKTHTSVKLTKYLLIAPLLLAAGCSDPDSPVGSGIGSGLEGTVEVRSFAADTAVSYAATPVRTGGSANIYVGVAYGVTSYGLVRFHRPVMPDNYSLDTTRDASVHLAYEGVIGKSWPYTLVLERLDFAWTEADSLTRTMLPQGVSMDWNGEETSQDTGSVSVTVPAGWVKDWLVWVDSSGIDTSWHDPSRADSGLTVLMDIVTGVPTQSDGGSLLRFRSRSAVEDTIRSNLKPRLYIPVIITDTLGNQTSDSLAVIAAGDMFILEYDATVTRDSLIVGSGVPWRALLRFDLTQLWALADSADIVVNRATLTLWRQPLADEWPVTRSIWPFTITDDLWLADPFKLAQTMFTVIPTAVDTARDTLQILVTKPATQWAKGTAENHGLALNSGGVGLDLDRIAFHPPDDPDSTLRPRLNIYFTRLAK